VTSDYVRAQVENHAGAVCGRKKKIGKIWVDLGWISLVHLEDVACQERIQEMLAAQP
jgi:AsmA family protein